MSRWGLSHKSRRRPHPLLHPQPCSNVAYCLYPPEQRRTRKLVLENSFGSHAPLTDARTRCIELAFNPVDRRSREIPRRSKAFGDRVLRHKSQHSGNVPHYIDTVGSLTMMSSVGRRGHVILYKKG